MKNPLSCRLIRELWGDPGKYLVIFLLLVFSISEVSGFLVADESMIAAYEESFFKYAVEHGHFTTERKLNLQARRRIENLHVTIYDLFFTDVQLTGHSRGGSAGKTRTVRCGSLRCGTR